MLDTEGLPYWPVRSSVEPLCPDAMVPVPHGCEDQRLPVRRPVRPVLRALFGYGDPGVFADRLWAIQGRNCDPAAILFCTSGEADPIIIRREAAVQNVIRRVLEQQRLPVRRE